MSVIPIQEEVIRDFEDLPPLKDESDDGAEGKMVGIQSSDDEDGEMGDEDIQKLQRMIEAQACLIKKRKKAAIQRSRKNESKDPYPKKTMDRSITLLKFVWIQ